VKRPPLDVDGRREPSDSQLTLARQIVQRSGLLEALGPYLDAATTGRPRTLSVEALLVGLLANALGRNHQGHLIDVARLLNALSDKERARLGITSWNPEETYLSVVRLYGKLCQLLEAGTDGMTAQWFTHRLLAASVPKRYLSSHALAVDGTDIETWGAFQGSVRALTLDGEAVEAGDDDDGPQPPMPPKRRAKVLAIGPDGRRQYTPDPDARAGHRSANGKHNAGPYLGYELHLGVQTRDLQWTNYVDKVRLGPEVPNVITTAVLVPAGTHRTKAVVGPILADKARGHDITEVIWDPGYSQCPPETGAFLLVRAGIVQTFHLVPSQRGIRPFSKEALLMDGQLYSSSLPADLRDLAMPKFLAKGNYRLAYEEPFNRRASWRFVRHSGHDQSGVTRWKCPFHAGLLRSRAVPTTMRRSAKVPLVVLPEGLEACCPGIVSALPADLPLAQKIPFGTTAWRISMNRRMSVESVNASLKGGFVNVVRGFFRVFGLVKVTVLLAFTLVGANVDRVRSHEAKLAEDQPEPPRRRRPRRGTWQALLGQPAAVSERSTGPPGT
jgi:hypothetical protein